MSVRSRRKERRKERRQTSTKVLVGLQEKNYEKIEEQQETKEHEKKGK